MWNESAKETPYMTCTSVVVISTFLSYLSFVNNIIITYVLSFLIWSVSHFSLWAFFLNECLVWSFVIIKGNTVTYNCQVLWTLVVSCLIGNFNCTASPHFYIMRSQDCYHLANTMPMIYLHRFKVSVSMGQINFTII